MNTSSSLCTCTSRFEILNDNVNLRWHCLSTCTVLSADWQSSRVYPPAFLPSRGWSGWSFVLSPKWAWLVSFPVGFSLIFFHRYSSMDTQSCLKILVSLLIHPNVKSDSIPSYVLGSSHLESNSTATEPFNPHLWAFNSFLIKNKNNVLKKNIPKSFFSFG